MSTLLDDMQAEGRFHVTTAEAHQRLGGSLVAARAILRRLSLRGRLAHPSRGFWVIVPPEYRNLGCPPPELFVHQLCEHLAIPYCVGLLSAAQRHGATHQQPQAFQLLVEQHRPRLVCGRVRVDFVARKALRDVPVDVVNTLRGPLHVATREATAFDVVGYPEHADGLDGAAAVVAELLSTETGSGLNTDRLVACAATAPLPWTQRLGFILDTLGATDAANALAEVVLAEVRDATVLDPQVRRRGRRNSRWKLDVNVNLEPDAEATGSLPATS
jgi:predicted transcriptional regulator of viral defense system